MTVMRALVKYPRDASDADKQLAFWIGIDDVIYELICEHNMKPSDVEDACFNAIEVALSDRDFAS